MNDVMKPVTAVVFAVRRNKAAVNQADENKTVRTFSFETTRSYKENVVTDLEEEGP
jgi:hypothetical protein